LLPSTQSNIDVVVISAHSSAEEACADLCRSLRKKGIACAMSLTREAMGKEIKKADRLGTRWVALIGEDEVARQLVSLKNLATGNQVQLKVSEVAEHIRK
jgi:histidyl-tRNA synthetase